VFVNIAVGAGSENLNCSRVSVMFTASWFCDLSGNSKHVHCTSLDAFLDS
jgi:hypothetical protein